MSAAPRTARRRAADAALLVADIGGTNARFGVWYRDALHAEQVLKCADFDGPAAAATRYLQGLRAANTVPVPRIAAFAVAGPLLEDRIALVDERLSHPEAAELPPATTAALKRERVVLLDSLVRVRYASAVIVSL